MEPYEQIGSRLVKDDARAIAVLGELEDCWFQVDTPAAQHRDELHDEVVRHEAVPGCERPTFDEYAVGWGRNIRSATTSTMAEDFKKNIASVRKREYCHAWSLRATADRPSARGSQKRGERDACAI